MRRELFFHQCEVDEDCLPYAHHRYSRCVYGRCAECRFDDDCDSGECLAPGLCYSMTKHPSAIYGTWLIGWYGGLDHFSYFRFEPDGTLRRATYTTDSTFFDDILTGGCGGSPETPTRPIIGTWEPEMTESGFLVIRLSFASPCEAGQKVSERFMITMGDGGDSMSLTSVDNPEGVGMTGLRINPLLCSADFVSCPAPIYNVFQDFLPMPPDSMSWNLVFHDEFEGFELDGTKWKNDGGTEASPSPRRSGYWVAEAMELKGAGHLVMKTYENDGKYFSGSISTQGMFEHTYGYYEARMKSSTQPGHWGAFWLLPDSFGDLENGGIDGVEIDVMERPWTGENATWTNHALHWDAYRTGADASEISITEGIDEGWHTYGLWWTPDRYYFYIDGEMVWTTAAGGVCQSPLYLILSDEVQSNAFAFSGAIEDAVLPDETLVDYVRVYDLAE